MSPYVGLEVLIRRIITVDRMYEMSDIQLTNTVPFMANGIRNTDFLRIGPCMYVLRMSSIKLVLTTKKKKTTEAHLTMIIERP